MATVAHLYRHPIKSAGAEALESAALVAGEAMAGDRLWAVAHEKSRLEPDASGWMRCSVFHRVATSPRLAAISARLDAAAETLTLTHPDCEALTAAPDTADGAEAILRWLAPLIAPGRPAPSALKRIGGRGFTDSPFPSVSIQGLASLDALSRRIGAPLDPRRFRGNIWLDGLEAWAEFDWIGREIAIGGARLRVVERITRCNAPKANPETGRADADTLGALEAGWDHTDFGVCAEVIEGGGIALGDAAAPETAP